MSRLHPLPRTSRAARPLALLGGDRRGTALIEFAILAAPLLALLLAILEVSLIFFSQQALETAAEQAARRLTTGAVQKAGTSAARFKADTCAAMPPVLRCDNLYIDVTTAASFAASSTARLAVTRTAGGGVSSPMRFSPGGANAVVVSRLLYVWPVSIGITNILGSGLLVATSVTKTEPYE